jgi:hypothetical protein
VSARVAKHTTTDTHTALCYTVALTVAVPWMQKQDRDQSSTDPLCMQAAVPRAHVNVHSTKVSISIVYLEQYTAT